MTTQDIVQKLWNLCDVLRDDGINYSDYVTELVLLLFIKMEHENTASGLLASHKLPAYARWPELRDKSGLNLLRYYRETLLKLSTSEDRLIAAIYADAQTSLKEPRHLEQLVKSLDGIDWFSARQGRTGRPLRRPAGEERQRDEERRRPVLHAPPADRQHRRSHQPQPGEMVQDPAAGTGGFLIAADRYIKDADRRPLQPDREAAQVPAQRRLPGHGAGLRHAAPGAHELPAARHGGRSRAWCTSATRWAAPAAACPRADIILSNPPFGTAKGGGGPTRDDFTFATGNKQLAFLQHIYRDLKDGGRAAVVLPDNVLFEDGVGRGHPRAT